MENSKLMHIKLEKSFNFEIAARMETTTQNRVIPHQYMGQAKKKTKKKIVL